MKKKRNKRTSTPVASAASKLMEWAKRDPSQLILTYLGPFDSKAEFANAIKTCARSPKEKKQNEHTSRRVASAASRLMEWCKQPKNLSHVFVTDDYVNPFKTVAAFERDVKACAGSCMSQAPDRPKKRKAARP